MIFFLIQLILVVLIGGIVGLLLGLVAAYSHSREVSGSLLRFFRHAQWIPYIVTWGMPVWPPREGHISGGIAFIWMIASVAVALATLYRYLILRIVLQL